MSEKPRTVLVCGGRDYSDFPMVCVVLDDEHARIPIGKIVHGAASGADTLADQWARMRGIEVQPFPADWKTHKRAAGPIRNREMLTTSPALVVAFRGGSGTADMIKAANKAGVPVKVIP